MVYQIKILSHEIKNDKVIYSICVWDDSTGTSKNFKYRYSQLKDFHSDLQQIVDKLQLPALLPEFPGRKLFGATNKSEDAILERRKELNNYLLELIKLEKLYNLQLFKKTFLPEEKAFIDKGGLKTSSDYSNIQMYIDRYTIIEDVVLYYARLRDLNTHDEWVFKYRYSDFRNLHDALEKSKIRFLPEFPKRKIFGITNDSPEDIEKRREELERYFNEIFTSKQLIGNPVVRFFVDDTKKQAQKELLIEKAKKDQRKASILAK